MRPLSHARAADADTAIAMVQARQDSAFLAGGTTEVDLVRQDVLRPGLLVDINDLPLTEVADLPGGGLLIGALARMSDVARSAGVVARFPVISQALLAGASAQLRNMASMGGNLCQRVRCSATHPSDVAVALVALDAVVNTRGPGGERAIGIDDFFLLPGDTPEREHPLQHGELITAIEVPRGSDSPQVRLKFRDRESYEFALVSVAAAVDVADGTIVGVRLALGGVGTKPWRARRAEHSMLGRSATAASFAHAAGQEVSRVDGPAKVAGAARYSGEIALAAGTGSTATTPLILGPMSAFARPVVAMVAFWWNDWPGSRLTAPWTGLIDTVLVAAARGRVHHRGPGRRRAV